MSFYSTLFIVLAYIFPVASQPDLNFIRYNTEHGLANNDVLSICQDQYGFMWFGTKDGVSRFDGMEFITYQHNEGVPGSINHGWVNGIVCDKDNNLWFALSGSGSPLMKYDYRKDAFIDMSQPIFDNLGLHGERVNCWTIFCDSEGLIWVVLRDVVQYNPQTGEIINFRARTKHLENFTVKDFFEDTDGNIWIVGGGAVVYNKKNNSFTYIERGESLQPGSLNSGIVYCGYQDSGKNIWLGTRNGFYKLVTPLNEQARFENFSHDPGNPFSLSNNMVYGFAENDDEDLFIGTINGLCLLDKETKKVFRYYNDEIDPESINSNLIRTIYRDRHNTIWVGTSAGVGKLQTKNFKSFSQSLYKNSISHNKVQCVYQGEGAEVWIGTPKGIDIFDRGTGTFRFFADVTKDANGLYSAPLTICPDMDGGAWIGTWGGGFSYYVSGEFKNYLSKQATGKIRHVFAIYQDSQKNVWIGASTKPDLGLYLFDPVKETCRYFTHEPNNENSLSSERILFITGDSEDQLWVGTLHGLNKLTDIKKGSFKRYLGQVAIHHIVETSNKNLWIGTDNGLYLFDKNSQTFSKIDKNNGLPGNIVFGILEDEFKNLWVSTDKGLARLQHLHNPDPLVKVFREAEGVNTGDFLPASCAKLKDGAMIFGSTDGFCLFHPDKIKKDTIAPTVVFTGLKVANQKVHVGDTVNNQVLLPQSITTLKQLVLNHKNNEFAISFSGLQNNLPRYNKYAYKLEKLQDHVQKWRYTTADDRMIEYMNLPSGKYLFKVKAANSYNVWNDKPAMIHITILPPWWETWWFRLAIGAMLVIIVLLIIKWRTYNLQKQKNKLEKIVEIRTNELKETNVILEERKEELEIQMLQMEQMNEELKQKTEQVSSMAKQLHKADELKLRFFANISHEFRTPLSLIIAPIDKCLQLTQPIIWDKVNISNYLQLINRNTKRLLRLVNQLIDFRKIDQNRAELNPTNNNIVNFIEDVVKAFGPLAEAKHIHLSFTIDHLSKNIDYSTFIKDHLTFNNKHLLLNMEHLSNEEDQLINDKCKMVNDKCEMINEFWFDPDIMEKILYNLISNAIKYTPEGGEILITVVVAVETRHALSLQPQLAIKISDTGIGIKPENLTKIFDRFYRVEKHGRASLHANQIEGTGIGLSYTKELVKLHKGDISAESEPGKGTTFTLSFPIEKSSATTEKPYNLDYIHSRIQDEVIGFGGDNEDVQNLSTVGRTGKDDKKPTFSILIVEDNHDLRNFISTELQGQYTIIEAENGESGLEKALRMDPDMVISDIMMPKMNGFELCENIKSDENTSHIPVILLTAKTSEEDQIKGLQTGADDYITKPFNISILKIKVKNIFEARRKIQEKFKQSTGIVPSEYTQTQADKKFLQKAIDVVNENMHNQDFNNEAFVNQMHYGKTIVYRKLRGLVNQSISEFIRSMRLKSAAQFFADGNDNVSDVCYRVGFKHPSVLTRDFKKMFGKTPSQFIKDCKK